MHVFHTWLSTVLDLCQPSDLFDRITLHGPFLAAAAVVFVPLMETIATGRSSPTSAPLGRDPSPALPGIISNYALLLADSLPILSERRTPKEKQLSDVPNSMQKFVQLKWRITNKARLYIDILFTSSTKCPLAECQRISSEHVECQEFGSPV
ncbi:hypothetical protein QJS10_CPB14g00234 [Acorus calamus]|uniref:Uncharacterized protein n=1 Tax=Acorus calamus TaxID=4465 RepID=A0AAV9DAK1_ACOCL|nr:hypothetical protein QJS10_CPB14g00234 [Acorus calamus]